MESKCKLLNMAKRCRICLVEHGCMTNLQDDRVEAKLKDLAKCTCIDIKHEKDLPDVVCHVCLYKLNMWTEFKELFIQSNKALLEKLKISEASDNIKDVPKEERHSTETAKRKRLNQSDEDSASDNEKKKSKIDVPSLELVNTCVTGQTVLDKICISDDNDNDNDNVDADAAIDLEPTSSKDLSKDSSQKVPNALDSSSELKKDTENGSEENTEDKPTLGPVRARLLPGRQRKNIQRRKASTKRWEERKKALFAAIEEIVSDSDSVASDDQLSSLQKGRAKTNIDKETEKQKRVAKVLKNLESNLTDKYTVPIHIDSDKRQTRLNKDLHSNISQQSNKSSLMNQANKKNGIERSRSSSLESSMEKNSLVSSMENNVMVDSVKKSESQADDETFMPRSLKSEVMIGESTFVITSKLMLPDSYLDKEKWNNSMQNSKSPSIDGSSHEKNTDIIDAVQLRRVNPVVCNVTKSVERCLNIEVEGHELAVLKRVQIELTDFIEKEVKHKLFGTNAGTLKTEKTDNADADVRLDQRLKNLIEKAIKKNIGYPIRDADDTYCQKFTTVSPAVVKAAMNSHKYQPKVILKRLDIAKASKLYFINNIHALKQAVPKSNLAGPFSAMYRKRQSVPPLRYNDYNTSALDSDSDELEDMIPQETSKPTNPRSYRTLAMKPSSGTNSQVATIRRVENGFTDKAIDNNVILVSVSTGQDSMNEQKADYEDAIKIEGAIAENHICGVCGLTFNSRKDVEVHVRAHKEAARTTVAHLMLRNENAIVPLQQNKQKKMRCKRCNEIVEACYVKAHVRMCKMTKLHKCYVCDLMFHTEKILVQHLASHDQSEFKLTNVIGNKKLSNDDVSQKMQSTMSQKDQRTDVTKTQNILTRKNDIQSDKITSTGVKPDSAEHTLDKPKETYTCFLCDKIFTDEEVLKDHLQKHCDDLSDGEQSNSKEQYQCAICGDTLESDQALEEHVGKHLYNNEDNNPNLISVDQDNENNSTSKEIETSHCGQYLETFDSEVLLEMQMQAHMEEVTIAEWEKQGMKVYQYQCMLCDELFDGEEELAEHLDIHNENAQVCQLCDKPFRTLEDLQEHVATH